MLLSLAIVGVMVGLMIGRLTAPVERQLQQVEVLSNGLALWFNEEPKLHAENVQGTVAVLFQAQGTARQGQLSLNGKPVSWRLQNSQEGLLLTVVAARRLHGQWAGAEDAGRWRLQVSLQE